MYTKYFSELFLVLILTLLVTTTANAKEEFMIKYAGTATDVSEFVAERILSEAEAHGSFGPSHVTILSKFVPFLPIPTPEPECKAGDIPFAMAYASAVVTFKDSDQLFMAFESGGICVTPGAVAQAAYVGKVFGSVVGGTGRFEGASGDVVADFGGNDISGPAVIGDPGNPGFGSFVGFFSGTIDLAD